MRVLAFVEGEARGGHEGMRTTGSLLKAGMFRVLYEGLGFFLQGFCLK